MNIYGLLCAIFVLCAGGSSLRGMDTDVVDQPYNALSLPNELWAHIAFACKTDEVSKETFLAHLMKLREVCTGWRDRLNDQFIADLVDLRIKAESYQELADCLAQAVKDENVAKIVMICKLYPNVSRVKALKNTLSKKLIVNNQSVKYLKLLIDLGTDPDSQMGKWSPFICYLFEKYNHDLYSQNHEHVYEACIDFLLDTHIDTTRNFLLDRAANNYCVYAMYKLLKYPIPDGANLTKVLGALCRNLIMHDKLLEVCSTLLARGATVPEGNLILQCPVERGILPMVLLLLQHGATLENSEWLCKNILVKYREWPNQEEAKILVPEIIACALDKEQGSLGFLRKRLNGVLEEILRKQGDGSYYFGGIHFYPCIKKLLAIGLRRADVFEEDRDTFIHILLSQSDPKLIDLALELKFSFNTWKDSKSGQTALHILAVKNDVASLQKLLAVGVADIDVLDNAGASPLARAYLHDAINYLVVSGANIHKAFRNYSAEACVQHVCYGQDDSTNSIECPVCGTALCSLRKLKWSLGDDACSIGLHTMYMQTLADKKSKLYGRLVTHLVENECLLKSFYTKYPDLLNTVDQNGDTVLHHAIKNIRVPVAQYLIQQPLCNVNICNNEGKRPLELVPQGGHHDEAGLLRDILIAHGAYVQNASRRIVAPAVIPTRNGALDPLPAPPVAVRSVRSEPIVIQQVRRPVAPVPHDNSQPVPKTFALKPQYMFGIATVLVAGYAAYRYWWGQAGDDADTQESEHERADATDAHSVVT
jgi:hypothetical protein